eukprot:366401-Chlamydomonas_euryale.AAC.9
MFWERTPVVMCCRLSHECRRATVRSHGKSHSKEQAMCGEGACGTEHAGKGEEPWQGPQGGGLRKCGRKSIATMLIACFRSERA